MQEFPYEKTDPSSLILRDHLAVDRTILASERTMLAYVRTALGFEVLGLTMLHVFETEISRITAYSFLGVGGFICAVGIGRFFRMRRNLGSIRR